MSRNKAWEIVGMKLSAVFRGVICCVVTALALTIPAGSVSGEEVAIELGSGETRPSEGAAPKEMRILPTHASGDLYALAVGISQYGNPAIPQLMLAAKDAKDFAAFLSSQKDLFRATKVTVLTDEQATKADVEKFLFYELRKAGKHDTVVLFFSGHGAVDPKRPGQFFFLTHDANPDFLEISSLNMSGLRFLKELDCPRIVMIADACHAGGFSRYGTKAIQPMKNFIVDFTNSSGRVIILSSRSEEFSLEGPNLGNGIFTHYLIQGLKGAADADGNGVVTVNEAYNYAYEATKRETEGAQHPQFEGRVEGIFPLSVGSHERSGPATSLELWIDPPLADVFVGDQCVGRTGQDGALCLKYLPVGQPVSVRIEKDGWKVASLGPFNFSPEKLSIKTERVQLQPEVGSLLIQTTPGGVSVRIDGRQAGTTDKTGRLLVHGLQVAVSHTIEYAKTAFQPETEVVTIPGSSQGKQHKGDPVSLAKIGPSAAPEPARTSTPQKPGATAGSERTQRAPARTRDEGATEKPTKSADPGTNRGSSNPATRYLHFDH